MDEDTKESVKELVFFEALPETRLKGKADPIALFAPLKEKPKKAGSTSVARSGRDEEYWRLRGVVAELLVYQEQSGLILLIGGRGSGKNILVQALESFGTEAGTAAPISPLYLPHIPPYSRPYLTMSPPYLQAWWCCAACRARTTGQRARSTGAAWAPPPASRGG